MSSTRNKNTRGDYYLEQKALTHQFDYKSDVNYGENNLTCYPGDSLLTGRLANNLLSHNANEVESQLFGIGSTNLVYAKPDTTPQFKSLNSVSMMDNRVPLVMPDPLVIQKHQRPYRS